eukprot:TRINITY_DN14185_c0_g1_i1.p1 TRINITY_DN14185_c0_g1~~TRINITY_DN14185_c0_g1_i1.p1  ORF type:complete len:205 (+),score=22.39 TRINITY_DN14185_c0_g1_i1:295-909(+)
MATRTLKSLEAKKAVHKKTHNICLKPTAVARDAYPAVSIKQLASPNPMHRRLHTSYIPNKPFEKEVCSKKEDQKEVALQKIMLTEINEPEPKKDISQQIEATGKCNYSLFPQSLHSRFSNDIRNQICYSSASDIQKGKTNKVDASNQAGGNSAFIMPSKIVGSKHTRNKQTKMTRINSQGGIPKSPTAKIVLELPHMLVPFHQR